jgi:hypothetical protein
MSLLLLLLLVVGSSAAGLRGCVITADTVENFCMVNVTPSRVTLYWSGEATKWLGRGDLLPGETTCHITTSGSYWNARSADGKPVWTHKVTVSDFQTVRPIDPTGKIRND